MSNENRSKKEILKFIAKAIENGDLSCRHDPIEWFFELSKLCNIRCRTCGRLYDDRFKDPGFAGNMKFEIMEMIEPHLSGSFLVHSVGFGEPFLNRRVMDFVRVIKKYGPYLDIITNGTLLDGKLNDMVNSGLDELSVSMDGGTPEVFDYFRVGAKWDNVAKNLAELDRKKKEQHSSKPAVTIEFVAMRGNISTLPRLVEVAATEWGARGITVENLYQAPEAKYMTFYLEQNLSNMPFHEMEDWFNKSEEAASKYHIALSGPYFDGDRHELWKNARVKSIGCVNNPSFGKTLFEPELFFGWAVHPCGVEKVLYRLGSGASGEARYGLPLQASLEKTDITPGMPDSDSCGFEIPFVPDMLEEGKDELFITVVDKTGGSTPFSPVIFHYESSKLPRMVVDYPIAREPVDNPSLILGWHLPPLPESLLIYVDDREMGEAIFGFERVDVKEKANRLGIDHPDLERCGFYLPLDLSQLKDGSHRLRIFSFDSGEEGKEVFSEKFELRRDCRSEGKMLSRAMGKIENPGQGQTVGDGSVLSGWVVYGPETDRILLLCDGEEAGVMGHMIPREDVRQRIGDSSLSDHLGFCVPLKKTRLSNGERDFSLVAVTRHGEKEVLDQVVYTVMDTGSKLTGSHAEDRPKRSVYPHEKLKPGCSLKRSTEKLYTQRDILLKDPSRKTAFAPYCTIPWTTTYIAFDGLVRPCCFSDPMMVLGDLNKQTFETIWNGKAYKLLRSEILEDIVPGGCRDCVANARTHGRAIFDKFNYLT